ncbi:MAG: PEP-CTERM sorting domain-containing protein [Gammaproteobacteria bacterium]|nr:PEP-CTERM sorting domain-containing protein [Gammaproteobacteria bacterium]MBU1481822.1 PEP-CTERM sorting domain-containing protein [Gammaproteobacteria bacterium]
MTNGKGFRGLSVAALAATALFVAQPATADIIEINNFWAGSGSAHIEFSGINWHDNSYVSGLDEWGGSGGFKTYNLSTDPNKQNAFQSFCVDIFSSFSFAVRSNDTLLPATIISPTVAADLGRLYTNHHAAIDSTYSGAAEESAFQLAVWEIVNEGAGEGSAYDLTGGAFKASGTGGALAQIWLNELSVASVSDYVANIWKVDSMVSGRGYAQDVVVFTPYAPVPEPQTYAMMLVGLGLLGFSARRKKQNHS